MAVEYIAAILKKHWLPHDPQGYCITSLLQRCDQSIRIRLDDTRDQMITSWLFTLVKTITGRRVDLEALLPLLKLPQVFEWSLMMSILSCFLTDWISRAWDQGMKIDAKMPPSIQILTPFLKNLNLVFLGVAREYIWTHSDSFSSGSLD